MIESKELEKLNKKLNKIGKELSSAASGGGDIPSSINDRLLLGAIDIRSHAILSIEHGQKTGKVYTWEAAPKGDKNIIGFVRGPAGGVFAIRKRATPHQASAPGEAPATDKGELARSIDFDARHFEVEVGTTAGAPYGKYLEGGTAGTKIVSMHDLLYSIDTPYMKARPFLRPAVAKYADGIIRDIGKDVLEIIGGSFKGK